MVEEIKIYPNYIKEFLIYLLSWGLCMLLAWVFYFKVEKMPVWIPAAFAVFGLLMLVGILNGIRAWRLKIPTLILQEKGILLYPDWPNPLMVSWKDIFDFEHKYYSRNASRHYFIIIRVKNPDKYLQISSADYKDRISKYKRWGTPIAFSTSHVRMETPTLIRLLKEKLRERGG